MKTLVIGAGGQLGQELLPELASRLGKDNVLASDLRPLGGDFAEVQLDVTDKKGLEEVLQNHKIEQIYLLAALLSATGEQNPSLAWEVNMQGLLNVLDLSVELGIKRVFWPSSIAVFGPTTPRDNTPQQTVMEPSTIYGITKQAGEGLCAWYHKKHGLDVRSVRYPGLISYKTQPGGGTTDYAVHIFFEALKTGSYTSFLSEHTRLPMMYMPDAVKATLQLMEAPAEQIKIRQSYNLSAISFTPAEIAESLKRLMPEFKMGYEPDFRQAIADTWPATIDDSSARKDWGWQHKFGLDEMVNDMLSNLRQPAE